MGVQAGDPFLSLTKRGPLPQVSLPRMSKVTIAEATAKLGDDMSRARWRFGYLLTAIGGTLGGLSYLDVIPVRSAWRKFQGSTEGAAHDDGDGVIVAEAKDGIAESDAACHHTLLREAVDQRRWKHSWTYMFLKTFLFVLAASSGGFVWAAWQDVADNASSSLKRWVTAITRGYRGWLMFEAAQLEKSARVFYHALTYASNSAVPAEQLVSYKPIMKDDDELVHLGYRGDSVRRFEHMYNCLSRILSLMYLITPKAQHDAVQHDVMVITQHLNGLADLVERDINNAESRFIVEYERETQMAFVHLFEELHGRLARYDIRARS